VISCEIPHSVRLKGKSHWSLELGSPFEGKKGLRDYISIDKVKEMMSSPGNTKETYVMNYDGPQFPGVQTYVVRYPIVEMALELSDYIEEAVRNTPNSDYIIPAIPYFPSDKYCYLTETGPSLEETGPMYKVSLYDMAKLVTEVKGNDNGFGVAVPYSKSFEDNLRVKIPAFGIDYDTPGERYKDSDGRDMLKFTGNGIEDDGKFRPNDYGVLTFDMELEIFIRLSGRCDGGMISIYPIFDWEEAIINPEDDDAGMSRLHGTYTINYDFGEFLGGAKFSDIRGYMYVYGVGNMASMSLLVNDDEVLISPSDILEPSFFYFEADGDLSYPSHNIISLTDVFNEYIRFKLTYNIMIDQYVVTRDRDKAEKIIADFVILLPLEMRIENEATDPAMSGYVKLELGEAFDNTENKDLFGREGDDDLFASIEEVEIFIKNKEGITAIDPNRLMIQVRNLDVPVGEVNFMDKRPSLKIPSSALDPPFIPRYEILYKKDLHEDYATLIIERDHTGSWEFDFKLTLSARVEIDKTIDF